MIPMTVRSTLLLLVVATATVHANVSLPHVFGDHMVLQRGQPIPVWGQAESGETVAVRFAGRERQARADNAGHWRVDLPACDASFEPQDLVVSGTNTLTLHDVLVGDVWLCSGQSNMEMAVGVTTAGAQPESAHDPALAEEIKTASYPQIRLFRVEKQRRAGDVVGDGWTDCRGDALARFSAVGFFFGRELQSALNVPIGLIESAWGGSRIEEWTPAPAYVRLRDILGSDAARCFERNRAMVARDYDSMIKPLAPFAVRGVIWYQGESNVIAYNDGDRYADKFAVMVQGWRQAWDAPELPFYAVQIAPYLYTLRKDPLAHGDDELPKLWEAQQLATTIPHTGLVPLSDTVADVRNIHPGGKSVVGHRLAALALAESYGRPRVLHTGPVFDHADFRDGKAIVHFRGVDGGLRTRSGNIETTETPPTMSKRPTNRESSPETASTTPDEREEQPNDFELAGADGRWAEATAKIDGDTVVVRASSVAAPTAVRFGWHEAARPNLENKAGWPAYPFRSDGPRWQPPR